MSCFPRIRKNFLAYVLLVLVGYAFGATWAAPPAADAEVRQPTTPKAFKSGGARSEIVLKEIAAKLEQMDNRLANLEKAAGLLVELQKKVVSH